MDLLSNLRRLPLVMLLGLLAPLPASATVIFSDSTFNDADWTMTSIGFGGGGSAAGVQITTDGAAYREVTDSVNWNNGSFTGVHGYSLSPLMVFNPATDGAISGIDYSYDYFTNGAQVGVALALKQDGNYFFSYPDAYSIVSGGWGTGGFSTLTVSDFALSSGSGVPDFSLAGSPIEVGFMTANSTPAYPFSVAIGIDNFSATLHAIPVPEPAAFGLGLAASVGLLRRRK